MYEQMFVNLSGDFLNNDFNLSKCGGQYKALLYSWDFENIPDIYSLFHFKNYSSGFIG